MKHYPRVAPGKTTAHDVFYSDDAGQIVVADHAVDSEARMRDSANLRPAGLRARRAREESRHRARTSRAPVRTGARSCRAHGNDNN